MDSAAQGGTSSLAGSCCWAFVFLDGEFLKFNMEIPENQSAPGKGHSLLEPIIFVHF